MFSMKEVCEEVGMSYQTLKFYCNEGLVPNVKRDKNNYRVFDDRNIAWLKGLQYLRRCGMSIKDMKQYLHYCLQGPATIPQRKEMLNQTKKELLNKIDDINECIHYINDKQSFYDDVLSGKIEYTSNLIDVH